MKKAVLILVLLLMASTLLIGGCLSSDAPKIESQEEAQEAVMDIGQDIDKVGASLENIDEALS